MSIVLKTDPKELAREFRRVASEGTELPKEYHDASVAQATQMALEEFRSDTLEDFYTADQIVNYIKSRAALNLARMLGEGNGN